MRHFLKRRTILHVEIAEWEHLNSFRMGALDKKNNLTPDSTKDSCIRLKTVDFEQRHCLVPPAPTDSETDEMFGLEVGLVRLPVMAPVSDPYVLEEVILFARGEKIHDQIHEMAEDLGLFDEEESKSTVDCHTIAPGSIRKKLDNIA